MRKQWGLDVWRYHADEFHELSYAGHHWDILEFMQRIKAPDCIDRRLPIDTRKGILRLSRQ